VAPVGAPDAAHETPLSIVVHERPQRPRITPIDTAPWQTTEQIDFQLQGHDADLPPDTLVYDMSIDPAPSSPPEFDTATGHFRWKPAASDRDKDYQITFRVWKQGHPDLAAREVAMVSLLPRPGSMLASGEAHRRLVADLEGAGLALESAGDVAESPFRGRHRQMKLAGAPLDIIEYDSDDDAGADARQLTSEAQQINGKPVRYPRAPKFFRRGTLIIAFAGDNAEHAAQLERLLGTALAEGKGMVAVSQPMPTPPQPEPMPTPPVAKVTKQPIPAAAEQERALADIREIYREQYKSKKPDQRTLLMRELMQKAASTIDDATARYALLLEAKTIAQEQAEVATGWQIIDLLAQDYQIDALEMKGSVLEESQAAARQPLENRDLGERYLTLLEEATGQERYDVAIALAVDAGSVARRSKDRSLIDRLQKATKDARDAKKDFEAAQQARETLAQSPDDPQANLALGCYLAFVRGQWEEGLPLLARSDAKKVASAAQLDLEGPSTTASQVAAGDAWWAATDAPKNIDKERVQQRAAHWYRLAMPQLAALERIKLEQKLEKLAPAAAAMPRNVRKPNAAPIPGLPPLLRADDPLLDRLAASLILRLKIGTVSIQLGNEERSPASEQELPPESFTVKSIAIQHAMANDQLLAYLRGLKALERLSLENGQGISDAGMAVVTELPQLKVLTLQLPQITDAALAHFNKVPQLEHLQLQRAQITDVGIGQLAGHQRLATFYCQSDLISDEALRPLAKLPTLHNLTLHSDRITGAGLPHLRSTAELWQLHLRSANLNDKHLAELLNQPRLQSLTLEGSVGDAAMEPVGKLPALQSLVLDSPRVTHAGFAHLASASQLVYLSLGSHGPLVNDQGLAHIAGLSSLVSLNIPHAEQVSDAGMEKLPRLDKLQALTLQNSQISDTALASLAKLPQLQHLAIDRARRVTDRGLASLKDAKQLRYLQLNGTQVTDAGVQALKQFLPECNVAK
jgi:Leucine-rich repeat (LRR) protein